MRLRSSSIFESGEAASTTFFKKSFIAVDSTVSHSRKLGHITDPVLGGSMSPIGIWAHTRSRAVVFFPLRKLGNSHGSHGFPASCARHQRLLVLNSADIQVIIICRNRSAALILTRCFWLLSTCRVWMAGFPDVG